MDEQILKSAEIALRDFMGLKENETLLIITDEIERHIGEALHSAGKKLCKESLLVEIKSREINGQEPPAQIAKLMKEVDVVVCPTNKSLTHTNARREAAALGVRVGTMPGISAQTMERCFNSDFDRILDLTKKVQKRIEGCKEIRVKTELGTDLAMPIEGRSVLPSSGVLRNKGESGNLPSGEVYLAPCEGKSCGKLFIDGSVAGVGMVNTPIEIDIVEGYAVSIKGGIEAEKLNASLSKVGKDAFAVAEFGIGTNYKAQLIGEILEDEKVLGTIHIAFGNNASMGGSINVPVHIDGLVKSPSVYLDGVLIMENGKFIESEL